MFRRMVQWLDRLAGAGAGSERGPGASPSSHGPDEGGEPVMKLIVGLGNPGPKYADTRHNAGFMVVDRLATRHGLGGWRSKFHAEVLEGQLADQKVMLMKPVTLMNRSGLAVGEAVRFFKLAPEDLLVLVDDVALSVGQIRLRAGGSSGGHNGLESIRQSIGTADYPRLRIGIDPPRINGRKVPQSDYVLSPFSDEQRRELEPALDRAADAVELWLREGIEPAMSRYNRRETKDEENAATLGGKHSADS